MAESEDKKDKKKRGPNWTDEQKMFLIELVKQEKDLLLSEQNTVDGRKKQTQKWRMIGAELQRRFPGSYETVNLLRSRWKMMVMRAKKQHTDFRAGTRRTGGGGLRQPDEWAAKICYELLPTEVIEGIPGGVDTGDAAANVIGSPAQPRVITESVDPSEKVGLEEEEDDGSVGHEQVDVEEPFLIDDGTIVEAEYARGCVSAPPTVYYLNATPGPSAGGKKRKTDAALTWESALTAEEKKFEAETEKLKAETAYFIAKTELAKQKTKFYKLQCDKLQREESD